MSKSLETNKIKVNNFSKMFVEMRKLKNSGGELKLLERHSEWTIRDGWKENSKTGFIMINGKQKVGIVYELDAPDPNLTTVLSSE